MSREPTLGFGAVATHGVPHINPLPPAIAQLANPKAEILGNAVLERENQPALYVNAYAIRNGGHDYITIYSASNPGTAINLDKAQLRALADLAIAAGFIAPMIVAAAPDEGDQI